ncbi:MAG: flagellar biosynthesis anti-sigma factor FlgM [Dethiobacter sp.]|jgi:flagellar biosynthesis anti-sigma factor FlgM|nr:flagellar biosynthesis anti-sigma factor FlgM [Dethiobacter sp.]
MKINDLTTKITKPLRKENQQVKSPASVENKKQNSDSVEISAKVKEVENLVKIALNTPVEGGRVNSIKEKIASGEYILDSKKLAERMLQKD